MSRQRDISVREVGAIIAAHARLFALIVAAVVAVAFLVWATRPVSYRFSVVVDITRVGTPAPTRDYTYDAYYRLEADKQFAETVAQWLRTPRVAEDVLVAARQPVPASLRARMRTFRVQRISSQSVVVQYAAPTPAAGRAIAESLERVLAARTRALAPSHTGTWFALRLSAPAAARDRVRAPLVLAVALCAGLVLAAGSVLALHALRPPRRRKHKTASKNTTRHSRRATYAHRD